MFLLRLMIVALLFPTNARLPQFQPLCLRAFASKNVAFAPVCPHHLHRSVRLNARLETFDWSHQERRSRFWTGQLPLSSILQKMSVPPAPFPHFNAQLVFDPCIKCFMLCATGDDEAAAALRPYAPKELRARALVAISEVRVDTAAVRRVGLEMPVM